MAKGKKESKKESKKKEKKYLTRTFQYEGKRYYVYGRSNKELNEKVFQKRAELEAGTMERVNPTLSKYYEQFTEVRRGSVRESTIRAQAYQFQGAASVPIDGNGKTLGELQIRDITPKDMQRVQMVLASSGRTTETVNNIMAHLKHVFNAAVRDETIDRNPCACIVNLKRKEKPARETIHRALSQGETERFFEAAKKRNSYYLNVFEMMIRTGMRVGEIGALTAFDIDEKAGVIHVRRTITRDEGNAYKIGDAAKTESGRRDIPLNPGILETIKKQKNLNRLFFGGNLPETLFTSPEGALLRDYSVDREMERCCKAANIERVTSHAFRATFATRFIEQRPEDYKTLSEILGHADISITLNLYTHVMEERKKAAMDNVIIKLG